MSMIDAANHHVSGANATSLALYEQACRELLCMVDDPVATVDRALAVSPELTMGHVLKAWLNLLGTEPAGIAVAQASCAAAEGLPADEREQAHLAAARALTQGRWREAGLRLEDLSARFPRDALALQVGHQIDFFRGDSRMLRDRIARALPAWDAGMPGWHGVLGMHAFGLEETGDYATAEAQGRRSVEAEPRDSWAWHAVAHVHEMRNLPREGIAWLEPARDTWSNGSFLATHNTWHLALYYLELDRHDDVLRLYDEAIGGTGSAVVLDLIDAAAILWRLHLRGVDVGDRFGAIADRWAAVGGAGQYAFNDLHAMIAYVGADRGHAQRAVIEAQRAAMETRTRQCRLHARGRPPRDAGDRGLRHRRLRARHVIAALHPQRGASLRGQPCPAGSARSHAARGGPPRQRPGPCRGARGGAAGAAAAQASAYGTLRVSREGTACHAVLH